MRDFNLYSVTLYQIQRFLAVAELSSFTKAAQRLNLAQPVVSKSVLSLEQTLGLILFLREKGSVRLTPAGQHFYTFWRTMVPMMEKQGYPRSFAAALNAAAATVGRAQVGTMRERWSVAVPAGEPLRLRGSPASHEYWIEARGRQVAEVSNRWFRQPFTYGVAVPPGEDDALLVAIALAVDRMVR